ncbi:MAG: WD40 repeat domain-containing protein [bacterium]
MTLSSLKVKSLLLALIICSSPFSPTFVKAATVEKIVSFSDHPAPVTEVQFAPGTNTVVSGTKSGGVYLWNRTKNKKVNHFPFLEYNSMGDWLPSTAVQYFMKALGWNPLASPVNALSFHPRSSDVLAVGHDFETKTRIFNLKTSKQLQSFETYDGTTDLEFSPEGVFLAILDWRQINVWNTRSHKIHRTLKDKRLHAKNDTAGILPLDLTYSPKGKFLAVSFTDGDLVFWKTQAGKKIKTVNVADTKNSNEIFSSVNVEAIDISPSGQHLVTVDWQNKLKLWSFPEGKKINTKKISSDNLFTDVAFSPQGNVFAVTKGKKLSLWSVKSLKRLSEVKVSGDSLNTLDFSPRGKYIATGSGYMGNDVTDNSVTVWKNPHYQPDKKPPEKRKKPSQGLPNPSLENPKKAKKPSKEAND